MLEKFPRPKLDDLLDEHGAENVWFQQYGATAHTSRRSQGIFRELKLFQLFHSHTFQFLTASSKKETASVV
jgi:hypothetical protein